MVQTAYNTELSQGIAGGLLWSSNNEAVTCAAVGNVYFGRLLFAGFTENNVFTCKLPDSDPGEGGSGAGGAFASQRDISKAYYSDGDAVPCVTKGGIWIEAEEPIEEGDDVYVRFNGKKQVQTFVLDGDLIESNTITVKINDTTYDVTYADSHVATMTAFALEIASNIAVESAVVGGAGNRTITITAAVMGDEVEITDEAITGGVSQANITVTETVNAVPLTDRGKVRTDSDSGTAFELNGGSGFVGFGQTVSDGNGGYLYPMMYNLP